jgi:hypothetical protein
MKFTITFKCPDAVDCAINECTEQLKYQFEDENGEMSESKQDEFDEASSELQDEILDAADKFIKYRELITVEFDTVENTAKVLVVK